MLFVFLGKPLKPLTPDLLYIQCILNPVILRHCGSCHSRWQNDCGKFRYTVISKLSMKHEQVIVIVSNIVAYSINNNFTVLTTDIRYPMKI